MRLYLLAIATIQTAQSIGTSPRQSLLRHEIREAEKTEGFEDRKLEGCLDCCNDGQQNVPCTDVEACAEMAPKTGRFALIFSYVGKMGPKTLPFLESAKSAAQKANKVGGWVEGWFLGFPPKRAPAKRLQRFAKSGLGGGNSNIFF